MTEKVTREGAAKLLGLTVAAVRKIEGRGHLRPYETRGDNNRVFYAMSEVLMFRRKKKAIVEEVKKSREDVRLVQVKDVPFTVEESNSVFEELDKGTSALECSKRCKVHPDKVESIVRSYERLTNTIILRPEAVKTINEMPLDGTFPVIDEDGVIALLRSVAKVPACIACKKKPRELCKGCAVPFVKRMLERGEAASRAKHATEETERSDADKIET
jgi:hypothetical protein